MKLAAVVAASGALALVLGGLGACSQRDSGNHEIVLDQLRSFSKRMCGCIDKRCADNVQAAYTKWGEELARNAAKESSKPISEAITKQFAETAQQYSECMTKAMTVEPTPFALDLPAPADKQPVSADAQIRIVRDRAAKLQENLVLTRLEVSYVRSDGTLDPTYGRLELELRPGSPADDPNRPIGAPVPPPVAPSEECQGVVLKGGRWRQHKPTQCATERLEAPRCNVVQIWSRARQDSAPAAALATVKLSTTESRPPQTWTFEISDPPRKIQIDRAYPDDCEPVLEKK